MLLSVLVVVPFRFVLVVLCLALNLVSCMVFNTAGIRTPFQGDWAAQPPAHSVDSDMDPSEYSTPHSHRSRSRSPVVPVGTAAPGATGVDSVGSSLGGPTV